MPRYAFEILKIIFGINGAAYTLIRFCAFTGTHTHTYRQTDRQTDRQTNSAVTNSRMVKVKPVVP